MGAHAILRNHTQALLHRIEHFFDDAFGSAGNPLRHLGALGLFFLWILVASGLYLYIVVDTSIEGVYNSIGYLSEEQRFLGGILRSLHRYATDGFMITMFLHVLHEWAYNRYSGFRLFSWMTGIPLIWLAFVSGIGGYWIVWDRLAQFSAIASMELFDWFSIFNQVTVRNFLTPESITDRFFTFLIFLHIGVPLLLILGLWAHVHRISRVDAFPARSLGWGTLLTLLTLSIFRPAISDAPADLALAVTDTRIDWFVLFIHPLAYVTSPAVVWTAVFGFTLLLIALPIMPNSPRGTVAKVDPPNCNGCRRCYVDCPYAAIIMQPHPDKPKHQIAVVDPINCAACGICAGACPSSTPFRSAEELVTGIDMPEQPIGVLRHNLEVRLSEMTGDIKVVIFGCSCAADLSAFEANDTAVFPLICTGMLPPSFVEYALRSGADGIVITGCRPGGCAYRLGNLWSSERLAHHREPYLRDQVPRERILEFWADPADRKKLASALDGFRKNLAHFEKHHECSTPYQRRTASHVHLR